MDMKPYLGMFHFLNPRANQSHSNARLSFKKFLHYFPVSLPKFFLIP